MEQEVAWDRHTIVLTEEDPEKPYQDNLPRTGRSYKVGQVKLLINEILFIIDHWSPRVARQGIHLVVAGSVTGEHFACLADMFPQIIKIDLWDPKEDLSLLRPGKKPMSDKIEFFNDYLTPDAAARYKDKENIFFVSDLRTCGLRQVELEYRRRLPGDKTKVHLDRKMIERLMTDPALRINHDQKEAIGLLRQTDESIDLELTEEQVCTLVDAPFVEALTKEQRLEIDIEFEERVWDGDHTLQKELILAMEPKAAMLKFRPPFDTTGDPNKTVRYFDGFIYKQVFSKPHSTECRLVPLLWRNGVFNPVYTNYPISKFERKFFYYNTELRDDTSEIKKIWKNPINGAIEIPDGGRLKNSYDTCYLLYVLDKYLTFMGYPEENKDTRFVSALALWDWILETIQHYKEGKEFDFDAIRRRTKKTTRFNITKPEAPVLKTRVPVPELSDILGPEKSETEEVEFTAKPVDLVMSFNEITFDDVDLEAELKDLS